MPRKRTPTPEGQAPEPAPLARLDPAPLVRSTARPMADAGRAADAVSGARAFAGYRARKAANTRAAHDADLALFADYFAALGVTNDAGGPITGARLASDPAAWSDMTHGLVSGFVQWLLREKGAAIASVNRALSTVRVYAGLAAKAGALDPAALALIKEVKPISRTEGKRIDQARPTKRRGHKKAEHTGITLDQARALKREQPDTPQGRRDALIMCLLLDHGLRVGELAALPATAIDLKREQFAFYRPKVDKDQTHKLSVDTLRAATAYLEHDAPAIGTLLRGSESNGKLAGGMKARAIKQRVKLLGEQIGLPNLSPHDCRHYWAWRAAQNGTPIDALRDAGGWSGLAMPSHYIEAAKISNERVRLDE